MAARVNVAVQRLLAIYTRLGAKAKLPRCPQTLTGSPTTLLMKMGQAQTSLAMARQRPLVTRMALPLPQA
jgi:hypothetical protein